MAPGTLAPTPTHDLRRPVNFLRRILSPNGAPVAATSTDRDAPSEPQFEEYPSRALGDVLSELEHTENRRVLDLGPACPENMAWFGDLGCHLEIFDLFSWLCDYRTRAARRGDSAIGAALDRLVGEETAPSQSSQDAGPVDLILAWDLIDYLELDEISSLFARLEPRLRDGTRVMMIASYRDPVPHRPRRHHVRGTATLACDQPAADGRPSPQHKERKLLLALPGFEVQSSYLMQRGVQEFVFRSGARPAADPETGHATGEEAQMLPAGASDSTG